MRGWLIGLGLGWLAASPAAACRLALQLALDVSGSVDGGEYRLQLDGLAWALEEAEVREALLAMPAAPVAVSVYEWSGRDSRRVIADWQAMRDEADVAALAGRLRSTARQKASVSTAIGSALAFGLARLQAGPDCARVVIDVSGDGRNNDGPRPQDVRPELGGIVVNALVVGPGYTQARGAMADETEELVRYFRQNVILGPDFFVEVADGYDDFARTMKRKLLKELRAITLGTVAPWPGTRRVAANEGPRPRCPPRDRRTGAHADGTVPETETSGPEGPDGTRPLPRALA